MRLKNCPFCGSDDTDAEFWSGLDENHDVKHGPGCMECGATAPSIEVWNKRTPPPEPEQKAYY